MPKRLRILQYILVAFSFFVMGIFLNMYKDNQVQALQNDNSKLELIENTWDMFSDDSYQKFITRGISYHDIEYYPKDLIEIKSNKYINADVNSKYKKHKLRKKVIENLNLMAEDFYKEFDKPIVLYSTFRSYDYQKEHIDKSCKESGWCSYEGQSEHQSGLAVDFWKVESDIFHSDTYNNYFTWLQDNAHKYGFTQSYQKGIAIDNYHTEPWHRRYVGIELATYLKENNISFTQYYRIQNLPKFNISKGENY